MMLERGRDFFSVFPVGSHAVRSRLHSLQELKGLLSISLSQKLLGETNWHSLFIIIKIENVPNPKIKNYLNQW